MGRPGLSGCLARRWEMTYCVLHIAELTHPLHTRASVTRVRLCTGLMSVVWPRPYVVWTDANHLRILWAADFARIGAESGWRVVPV